VKQRQEEEEKVDIEVERRPLGRIEVQTEGHMIGSGQGAELYV
jgi:hypothetical protein